MSNKEFDWTDQRIEEAMQIARAAANAKDPIRASIALSSIDSMRPLLQDKVPYKSWAAGMLDAISELSRELHEEAWLEAELREAIARLQDRKARE